MTREATAYLIDPSLGTVERFRHSGMGNSWKEHLPGGMCLGWHYNNGDVLYVDDEALLHPAASGGFRVRSRPDGQPMMSKGVLVGAEWEDRTGWGISDPAMTLDQARAEFEMLSREQALAWFRERAHRPAVTTNDGSGVVQVHARWSDILRTLEGGEGYNPRSIFG